MKRVCLTFAVLLLFADSARTASAGLFIAPQPSDAILSIGVDDNSYGPLNLGFTMPFFGSNQTQAFFGSNGYLTFGGGDTTFGNYGFPSGMARIAPFFDDLYLPPGSIRFNNSTPGEFVAIWDGVGHFGSSSDRITAEVVLLGAGNSFGATSGTIVFSYGTVSGGTLSPTVGLNKGDGAHFTTLSGILGASNGVLTNSEANNLSDRTFFFTPMSGGYSVTETLPQTAAVPEPSSLILLGMGSLAFAGHMRWRRR